MANIILVHGAFADGSSWRHVIPLLQDAGHTVIAVQLPLSSLNDDIALTRQVTSSVQGPTVLAAHSYGGAAISGAGSGLANVTALVYIAAFAPAEGETVLELNQRFPATPGLQAIRPGYAPDVLIIDREQFPQVFAGDVDPSEGRVLAAAQKPVAIPCNTQPLGPAAWQTIPSWYLISENDQTVNPDLQRMLASRMHATTRSISSSHASLLSHPQAVAEIIMQAASGT